MSRRLLRFALLLTTVITAAAATPARPEKARLLAVGDVHGSLDGLTTILRETGLVDADGRWSGGRARLVQTGDFTDRGGHVREVMDLLMGLQSQARAAGGSLTILLGNHELLNLMRHDADVRVNPRIYASFVDDASAKKRREALEAWRGWWRERQGLEGLEPPAITTDEQWLERHPPGFVEYQEAMSVTGRYGRWLRTLPVVHRVGDTVFLHGGISETFSRLSLDRINELHREEIVALDRTIARLERKGVIPPTFTWDETVAELQARRAAPEIKQQRGLIEEASWRLDRFLGATGAADSPLWYRGFARPPRGVADGELRRLRDLLLEAYGARRFVVAHSPSYGQEIAVRLDAFFLIDTGMLASVYGGRPSALEINGEDVAAIYPGQRQQLLTADRPGVGGSVAALRPAGIHAAVRPAGEPRFVLASARPQEPDADANAAPIYEPPQRGWRDREGNLLPFDTPEDVERFLREATIVSSEPVGEGKTGALRLELERAGVEARAIFHDIDDHRSPASSNGPIRLSRGTTMLRFRDSYTGQVAAYRLARLMGLDNVPPTVIREVDGVEGSLALWIEGGINLTGWRRDNPRQPQHPYYLHQLWDMRVFDALINNKDRNTGNIFWTPDWSMWLIDHTRTFAQDPNLYRPDLVQRCSRDLLARIKQLDEKEAIEALEGYVSGFEVKAIFKRRKRLLRLLDQRIEKLGEDRVLFDYGDPAGWVVIRESDSSAV